MKLVKYCLLPIFLLLAAICAGGYLLDERWMVTESVSIQASPVQIFPYINDPKRWEEWRSYSANEEDTFSYSYEGSSAGAGAVATCEGSGSSTRREVTSSNPTDGVWLDERINGTGSAKAVFIFTADDGGTLVSWENRGSLGGNPILRYFHQLNEEHLRGNFKRSLSALKNLVESAK
jgi:hypothetical protein